MKIDWTEKNNKKSKPLLLCVLHKEPTIILVFLFICKTWTVLSILSRHFVNMGSVQLFLFMVFNDSVWSLKNTWYVEIGFFCEKMVVLQVSSASRKLVESQKPLSKQERRKTGLEMSAADVYCLLYHSHPPPNMTNLCWVSHAHWVALSHDVQFIVGF